MPDDVAGTPVVRRVQLYLCDPCLDGAAGECHTPGCSLWMNRAPDLPLRNNQMVTVTDLDAETAEEQRDRLAALARDMLSRFVKTSDGHRARVGQVQIAAWEKQLGGGDGG